MPAQNEHRAEHSRQRTEDAKALKWECAWHVGGTTRDRQLEHGERGQVARDETRNTGPGRVRHWKDLALFSEGDGRVWSLERAM